MPINPNIALSVNQPDPVGAYSRGLQVREARNQLLASEAATERVNQLRQYLSTADINAPETRNALMGMGPEGMEYVGQLDERKKALLDQQKSKVEMLKRTATFVMANPELAEKAIMNFGASVGQDMSDTIAQLRSFGGDTEAVRRWASGYALEADKLMTQFETLDTGGQKVRQGFDPLTGQAVGRGQVFNKTLAPGEAQRLANEGARLGLDQARLGLEQRRVELAERGGGDANAPAPSMTEIVDPANPKRMLRIDARRYQGGSVGSPGVIGVSGKEPTAAAKELQSDEGREQVDAQVANLKDIYRQLHEGGGITDPEKGAIANVVAGVSSSGPGQAAGRLVGTRNQSLRNQIAQARPLLLQAIKNATGMSAKQMDSNVELKMYLAAATDPTLDIDANLAALDNLSKLYGIGSVVGAPSTSAPEGVDPALWSVMTPEERALWQN